MAGKGCAMRSWDMFLVEVISDINVLGTRMLDWIARAPGYGRDRLESNKTTSMAQIQDNIFASAEAQRKLESSSYHALGACLRPYNAFLRRSNCCNLSMKSSLDMCEEINENSRYVSFLLDLRSESDFLTVESVATVFLLDVATDWFILCLGSLVLIDTSIGCLVLEFTPLIL
ncbi:hypothetical protein Tco_1154285 [Tanacetum coccineum]